MHSGKPDLRHILLSTSRITKEVLAKECPTFVYGDCVPNRGKIGIVCGCREWEMNSVVDPADRTNRVPYADKVWFALARICSLEISGNSEINFPALNHSDGVWDKTFIAFREEPDGVQHHAEGT